MQPIIPWILKLTDLNKIRANNQLDGQTLYMTYCKGCHGADMKGGSGPDITTRVKKYRNDQVVEHHRERRTADACIFISFRGANCIARCLCKRYNGPATV